jgi:ribosomal protein L40E
MPFVSLVPFQDIDPAFQDIMRTYDREYGCSEFHALLQVRLRASGRTKFCAECGARLPQGCLRCGAENAPAAKFCAERGAPLNTHATAPAPETLPLRASGTNDP